MRLTVALGLLVATSAPALGGGPEPDGPHPRIWLDDATLSAMREDVDRPDSGVARAIALCRRAARDPGYRSGGFRGTRFASAASSCALAHQVTGDDDYAAIGLRFFRALLDDYRGVGDGEGGDDVVSHGMGYSVRFFAPYAALAYDWLHDAPGMTPSLRAHARARFRAWTDWYRDQGYLRDAPGANYHAGYAFAVALIAVAQAGEAGDHGAALWRRATEEIFGDDIARAIGAGGVLEGGDWPEGWQYGSLSVLEYALGARALREQGASLPSFEDWADSLVRRHVHGLTPGRDRMWVGGDTGADEPYLEPSGRALYAVIAGPAGPGARAWARAELAASGYRDDVFPVFQALAEARPGPTRRFPREREPTAYLAPGTSTLYARTSWARDAVWFVAQCANQRIPDHQHLAAGTFALSRGDDHLVVDPSPYGSLSTLTGNAPTVVSPQLPPSYRPSQAPWGRDTRFRFVERTRSGVVVARCDYRDQYRFKQQPSDVDRALRDFVFVPGRDGTSATLLVWDRAITGAVTRTMHLRVRTPGRLADERSRGVGAEVGGSALRIRRVDAAPLGAVYSLPTDGECWDVEDRGRCRLSRVGGTEYRLVLPGPAPEAVHVLGARGRDDETPAARFVRGDGFRGVEIDDLLVIRPDVAVAGVRYRGPAESTHVVLGAPAGAEVKAVRRDERCRVRVSGGDDDAGDRGALIVRVGADCTVESRNAAFASNPTGASAEPDESARADVGEDDPAVGSGVAARVGTSGCAGCASAASGDPAAALMMLLLLLAALRGSPGRRG